MNDELKDKSFYSAFSVAAFILYFAALTGTGGCGAGIPGIG